MLSLQRCNWWDDLRDKLKKNFEEEVSFEMGEGLRVQNRDIELLIFLGKYKVISLDNTRYIYETVTYQEKRMVVLAKHNYIRRLKHRYITLGIKGKWYLLENGFEVL